MDPLIGNNADMNEKKRTPLNEVGPKLTKTSMFTRMNYQVERGMNELLSTRNFTKDDWSTVLEFFDFKCCFCGNGDTGNKRTGIIPDHLIPASEYGELCLGNVVPSCHSCNDRRGDSPWRDFLNRNFPAEAPRRARKLEAYLSKYPYSPVKAPSDVLTGKELAEFRRIKDTWAELWKDAKSLRKRINNRRKGGI